MDKNVQTQYHYTTMSYPSVIVPASLWLKVIHRLKQYEKTSKILTQCEAVDVPDLSPEAETRRKKIIDLVLDDGFVSAQIDQDAQLFEGEDNGCYVSARVWCTFEETEFDKVNNGNVELQEAGQ